MKERPILFTPENAQKVHEGVKTQTRRIVKDFGAFHNGVLHCGGKHGLAKAICPYGQVGDRLWIREAFCLCGEEGSKTPLYRGQCEEYKSLKPIWKPSLHMPRWACRTVVELTEIRVERLHDISPSDALAEGIFCPEVGYAQHGDRAPVLLYRSLWASINGQESWGQNPWVWVLTFKRVVTG